MLKLTPMEMFYPTNAFLATKIACSTASPFWGHVMCVKANSIAWTTPTMVHIDKNYFGHLKGHDYNIFLLTQSSEEL